MVEAILPHERASEHPARRYRAWTSCAIPLVAMTLQCAEEEAPAGPSTVAVSELVSSYDAETRSVFLDITAVPDAYVVECTDFVRFYRMNQGVREQLTSATLYPLDAWVGYILDGEIVPPVAGLGCDIRSCTRMSELLRSDFELVAYELVGVRTLTDEEKTATLAATGYAWSQQGGVPDTLNEYTSSPILGTVEVELTHYTSQDCDGAGAAARTEIQTFRIP
jgi:hypothetical protein